MSTGKLRAVRRGLCPVCRREFGMLVDGRIGRHGIKDRNVWPPEVCPGWGRMAEETK